MRDGVEELARWLEDLVRRGLVQACDASHRNWDELASRMVDAQAPGLARMVRDTGELVHAGPSWEDRVLRRIGDLHLLLQAYRRLPQLPPPLQHDVRALVGFPQRREALLNEPAVVDHWWVVGRRLELQDNLRVQRTWLHGERSRRHALILTFAAGMQHLDTSMDPGTRVEAELVFYPSAVPLRALVRASYSTNRPDGAPPGLLTVRDAYRRYGSDCARLPWIGRYPMGLRNVVPLRDGDGWLLVDERGDCIPMRPMHDDGWILMALSVGEPIGVFGELVEDALLPMGAYGSEGYTKLAINPLFVEGAS